MSTSSTTILVREENTPGSVEKLDDGRPSFVRDTSCDAHTQVSLEPLFPNKEDVSNDMAHEIRIPISSVELTRG